MNTLVNTFEYLEDFNAVSIAVRLALATLMGGIIGMERGATKHAAGLRTFMLVCLGACLAQIVNLRIVLMNGSGDPLRMAQGVVNGIGFLGVGTIIVTGKSHIKGLTTAATLWTTAVLGISIGSGYLYSSLLSFALVMFVIKVMAGISHRQKENNRNLELQFEIRSKEGTNQILSYMKTHNFRVTELEKVLCGDAFLLRLEVDLGSKQPHELIVSELEGLSEVVFVTELF